MIRWAIFGTLILIGWAIQARVNAHDELAGEIFEALNFRKIFFDVSARYLHADSDVLDAGLVSYQSRVISLLKETYSHRQMKQLLKKCETNSISVRSETIEIRETIKEIAKQVAKSYVAMLKSPNSDISSRPKRRRRR